MDEQLLREFPDEVKNRIVRKAGIDCVVCGSLREPKRSLWWLSPVSESLSVDFSDFWASCRVCAPCAAAWGLPDSEWKLSRTNPSLRSGEAFSVDGSVLGPGGSSRC